MADAPGPAAAGGGGAQPTTIVRNIIVGAITTILGSTTVYFITHGKDKDKSEPSATEKILVGKEVTTKAWKSFVAIDNIYYKNIMGLTKELLQTKDLLTYKREVIKEGESFKKDLESILKDPNLDNSFSSLLNRRLDREKESMEKVAVYIDNLEEIRNKNISQEEKMEQLKAEDNRYNQYSISVLQRAATEVEDLAKNLSEKYAQPFNVEDFIAIQDYKKLTNPQQPKGQNPAPADTGIVNRPVPAEPGERKDIPEPKQDVLIVKKDEPKPEPKTSATYKAKNFTGAWNAAGAVIMLSPDGEMIWDMPNGDEAYGTWKFANNQIMMNATLPNGQRAYWVFNLSNITANSFTMVLNVQPYNTYYLTRNTDYRDSDFKK